MSESNMGLSRRDFAARFGLGAGAAFLSGVDVQTAAAVAPVRAKQPFRYCFNTSTIRGQKLPLPEIVDLVAKAGYTGIEPWLSEIEAYVQAGGKLEDLRKRLADQGIAVESAIGFTEWIVDDDAKRAAGVEATKRAMELVKAIGGTRLAAPPVGAHAPDHPRPELIAIAERYRALLDLGVQTGVTPLVELWGFSRTLSRLGEVSFVAVESARPQASILTDVYHLHKGGSDAAGLTLVHPRLLSVMHFNDYPADVPREKLTDADRVYPGDGGAPLVKLLRSLADDGYELALSLELFNRGLWEQEASAVVRIGKEKMQAVAEQALA